MNKSHCAGCTDDFYNHRETPGFDGATECWSLKSAHLKMRRRVAMDERPPWTRKPEKLPSCYRKKGYIFVDPKVER